MGAWSEQELTTIDQTDELGIASRRPDGTLRPFVTIWVVRVGDEERCGVDGAQQRELLALESLQPDDLATDLDHQVEGPRGR